MNLSERQFLHGCDLPKPADHNDWAEKLEQEVASFDLATSFGVCQAITLDTAGVLDSGRGPGMATAMQEQLRLKLKPGKGPVPLFVIDAARKVPEEN